MKSSSVTTPFGTTIALLLLALPQIINADCLVGDIMYSEGDSIGQIGLECINSTSFDGNTSVCGSDGQVIETEMELTCPDSVPYCMQCGPRGWGAALCLSTPDLGNRDCGDDNETEEDLPLSTPALGCPRKN